MKEIFLFFKEFLERNNIKHPFIFNFENEEIYFKHLFSYDNLRIYIEKIKLIYLKDISNIHQNDKTLFLKTVFEAEDIYDYNFIIDFDYYQYFLDNLKEVIITNNDNFISFEFKINNISKTSSLSYKINLYEDKTTNEKLIRN